MVKLLRYVCPSAFPCVYCLLLYVFVGLLLFSFFYLYLAVYLSASLCVPCLCLWAMLPDLNKMMNDDDDDNTSLKRSDMAYV